MGAGRAGPVDYGDGAMSRELSIPVWTWRDAVRKAAVPPLTKLVCYSIANYLSDIGEGCFPSIRTLMADTGLSNRSLATHIQIAADEKLLVVARQTGHDGRYQRTLYKPRFPDHCDLPRDHANDVRGGENATVHVKDIHAARPSEGASPGRRIQVKELHADRPSEGASRGPREPDDAVHVNLVHDTLEPSKVELSKEPPNPHGAKSATGGQNEKSDLKAKADRLLSGIETMGPRGAIAAHLLRPILEARRFSAADKAGDLAALVEAAKGLPTPALDRAASLVLDAGTVTVKTERIREAIAAVRRAGAMVVIRRGTAQWARWAEHFATADPKIAALMDRYNAWQVRSEWPPGAPSQERAA